MLIFDIETGPLAEDVLRQRYVEPTWEDFNANCDQRWKPETRLAKFEEAKVNGWQAFVDRAALDATTGQVLAIGYMSLASGQFAIGGNEDGSGNGELTLLEQFWQQYQKIRAKNDALAGCNIFGFDLPFLIRRSWILNVDVPSTVYAGRYWDRVFMDLRDRWLLGQRWGDCPSSVDHIARALGVGAKNGDGKDFARLWKEDREQAKAYLRNDLEMTAGIARRMGVAA